MTLTANPSTVLSDGLVDLFECAPVGYLVVDEQSIIVRANAAAVALLGEQVGQPFSRLLVPEDRAVLDACISTDEKTSGNIRLPKSNGLPPREFRFDMCRVSGRSNAYLVVLSAAAEHVAALQAELETERCTRRELEDRLRGGDRLESLGLLAAGIAHDFNNLLAGVLGNTELLLLSPNLPEAWKVSLELIKNGCFKASGLTNHLLQFAGQGELSLRQVALSKIIEIAIIGLRNQVPMGIRISSDLNPALPYIAADANQIKQVLNHLVTNAAEALGDRGTIEVRTFEAELSEGDLSEFQQRRGAEPGRYVVLQVKDAGPGMELTILDRIFDPFFTTKFTGRGLGLASVLGIVHGHRGALRVRTALGEGTCFDVALRVGEVDAQVSRARQAFTEEWRGSGQVLLVDDDDAVRYVIGKMLGHLGFEVIQANGGQAGLDLFRLSPHQFRFVLLDWMMPGLTGEHALREMRAIAPDVPVIVISGYAESASDQSEPFLWVQKPVTMSQLQRATQRILATAKRHAAELEAI